MVLNLKKTGNFWSHLNTPFYLDFASLFIRLPNHPIIAEEQGETGDETIVITLDAESDNFHFTRKVDLEKLRSLLPET